MRVMVTGGQGYVGKAVLGELLKRKKVEKIYCVDDGRRADKKRTIGSSEFRDGDILENICRDFSDSYSIGLASDCDFIIHLAAYAYVGESQQSPGMYYENNVANTISFLEGVARLCKLDGKKLPFVIFASSCVACAPQSSAYANSKRICEQYIQNAWKGKYAICRLFNVAGANKWTVDNHNPETHLIPNIINAYLHKTELEIFVDTSCREEPLRRYIHVDDVARSFMCIIDHPNEVWKRVIEEHRDIFDLYATREHTITDIVQLFQFIVADSVKVVKKERRSGDLFRVETDGYQFDYFFDLKYKYDIEDMIKSQYRWIRK